VRGRDVDKKDSGHSAEAINDYIQFQHETICRQAQRIYELEAALGSVAGFRATAVEGVKHIEATHVRATGISADLVTAKNVSATSVVANTIIGDVYATHVEAKFINGRTVDGVDVGDLL
jgi:hypothetical protein